MEHYTKGARGAAELVERIERAVSDGELEPGRRLESVRGLAAQTGLSTSTVAAALAELRRRGLVVTDGRRGTRVASPARAAAAPAPPPLPAGARDLSRGNPDPALLPDLARALERCSFPTRLYGEAPVLGELARLAREQLGGPLAAGELCVVSGALEGIELVLLSNLRAGDRVAVESPGYAALYDLLRANGLRLEPVALDEHGILPDALESTLRAGAAAVVMTPRAQNPSGAVLDARRARALSTVLARHPDVLAIEDDHFGMLGEGEPHSALRGLGRWAAACSVSKALGPDLRLAVLGGDERTIARAQLRQQCGQGWVSHVLQRLVVSLWRDPGVQAQLRRARATYSARRERLLAALQARGIPAQGASGLNVWIPVPEEAAVAAALMARGWVVAAGAPYRLAGGPPAVRVTTATLAEREAGRLADDLAAVLAGGARRSG